MALILAADTSTAVNTVALARDGEVLAELSVNAPKRHAERLLAMTHALLEETGESVHNVDCFAISIGPGSFTGLRIGVSTWKGLALGCGKPLIGVCSLDALARACPIQDGTVAALLDAKMQEVYAAVYEFQDGARKLRIPPCVGPVEKLLEDAPHITRFAGEGAHVYQDRIRAKRPDARFLDSLFLYPRAAAVALEALDLSEAGASGDAGRVNPLYLRQSQPEEARKLQQQEALAT